MKCKSKKDLVLINFYVPNELLSAVNQFVVRLDTDKSKFIRSAIREKLEKHGYSVSDK